MLLHAFLVLVGTGLVRAADVAGTANETPAYMQDGVTDDYELPNDMVKTVYVVEQLKVSDADYREFVHTILQAKLDHDGHVYVKVAGEDLQVIEDADDLVNVQLVGNVRTNFHAIAGVLSMDDDSRKNIVMLSKDGHIVEEGTDTVLALIHAKQAKVNFVSMETSSINQGIRAKRQAPTGMSVFQQIAQASGGMVVTTTKANIGSVANLLKLAVHTDTVDILRFNYKGRSTVGKSFQIPVDETMTAMTLQIQTTGSPPIVMITQPSGVPVPPTAGQMLGTSLELFEFNMTKPSDYGQWKVIKAGSSDWDVKVTGQSLVDFSFEFMEPGSGGIAMYPIKGRPIGGKTYQLNLWVPAYDAIKVVNLVMLVGNDSMPVAMPMVVHNVGGRRGKATFTTNITLPTRDFRVSIDGMDKSNRWVHRLKPALISPVTVDLIVPPMNDAKLYTNWTLAIPFTVVNEANTKQEVIIQIEDDRSFSQSPFLRFYDLAGHENQTNHFTIRSGASAGVTCTFTITAKPYIRGVVTKGQFALRRVTVQERKPTTPGNATQAIQHSTQSTTLATGTSMGSSGSGTSQAPHSTQAAQSGTQSTALGTSPGSAGSDTSQAPHSTQAAQSSTQSTTPATGTKLGSSGSGTTKQPSAIQNLPKRPDEKVPIDHANLKGLHGYLHLLLKYMDTDFEVEIAE